MSRLVAVSQRVWLPDEPGGAGGLARSVRAALVEHGGLWFGWDGTVAGPDSRLPQSRQHDGVEYLTLPMPAALHADAYLGFSNDVLWPTLHGLAPPRSPVPLAARYSAYRAQCRAWATTLRPRLQATDLVWIHDYQLLPLAAALRARGHLGPIGFFLHVPFPPAARWRELPMHAALLRELLACDVVGFQTVDDLGHFADTARMLPGVTLEEDGTRLRSGPWRTALRVRPVGVDVDALQARVASTSREAGDPRDAGARLRERLGGRRCIAGIDRLDYTKGLVERITAYDEWLTRHPGAAAHTAFLQVAAPSRGSLPAYTRTAADVAAAVDACNRRHGCARHEPVVLLQQVLAHDAVLDLLAAARVACVTPRRDGMNLVAQEFVAVQPPGDPGVLSLSRGAGVARTLTDALQVDGADPGEIHAALTQALQMPADERRRRHASMLAALRRHSLAQWHGSFVADLACAASRARPAQRSRMRPALLSVTRPTGT